MQKKCYICKRKFENKYLQNKKYRKIWDDCHYTGEYRGAPLPICNLKCSVSKKVPTVFIKDLAMIIILS